MSDGGDRRFLIYTTCVCLAAAAAMFFSVRATGLELTVPFVTMAFFMVTSEALSVTLPLGNMSLAHPLSVAAAVLLGPSSAPILAGLSQVPSFFGPRRVAPAKVAFNIAQLIFSTLVAGWAYRAAGGRVLLYSPLNAQDFPRMVLPVLGVSLLGVLANFALAGYAVHLLQSVSVRHVWRSYFAGAVPTQVALGLVGVTIAQVVSAIGSGGLLLFVVPLLVARSTYHRYAELNQTYGDTIRSLVAALEASDLYTKGHSVRVAKYCVQIARHMNLDEEAVRRLEYAALLHDLGKVGIPPSILLKDGKLTEDEFSQIRRHPDIGAHIIDSVPFLEDLVPVVRHHHERVDGSGYGHGLSGDGIPLAARIMAVADAYDAMTSKRPYRDALHEDVARAELIAGAGTQFDAAIVEAFCEVLDLSVADMPVREAFAEGW